MAGLIFLWQNVQNAPAIEVDYGIKPHILLEDSSPIFLVSGTDAVFGNSIVLVNDSLITVNDINSLVGGSDILSGEKPIISSTKDLCPNILVWDDEITLIPFRTDAVFGSTITLVNDTVMTVNGTSLVGGSDILSGEKPILFEAGNL